MAARPCPPMVVRSPDQPRRHDVTHRYRRKAAPSAVGTVVHWRRLSLFQRSTNIYAGPPGDRETAADRASQSSPAAALYGLFGGRRQSAARLRERGTDDPTVSTALPDRLVG